MGSCTEWRVVPSAWGVNCSSGGVVLVGSCPEWGVVLVGAWPSGELY